MQKTHPKYLTHLRKNSDIEFFLKNMSICYIYPLNTEIST